MKQNIINGEKASEPRKRLGNCGEDIALEYLLQNGYHLIVRNFQCKMGEIDLIVRKGDTLVFVEVRSRTGKQYGDPSESVNRKKQDKIRKTAKYYLYQNRSLEQYYCRFDVVAIVWEEGNYTVEWIVDAFM